jgi:hypothetical protein
MQTTANDQRDGRSQINITNLEPSLDLSSSLEGEMSEPLSSLRAEAMTAEPQHISSTQPMEWSSTDYTDTNGGHVLRRETKRVESTCTDDENNEPRPPRASVIQKTHEKLLLSLRIDAVELRHITSQMPKPKKKPRNRSTTGARTSVAQVEQHFIGTSDDVPFTDSGYSSLRNNLNHPSNIPSSPEKPQCPASTEQSISMNDVDRDDAKTSYSAATTVGPVHAQHYIAELCADIYGKLRQCFDSKLWGTLSRALPVLIKAFAIKIGHDSSAQVNQEIMYFLHRRHE